MGSKKTFASAAEIFISNAGSQEQEQTPKEAPAQKKKKEDKPVAPSTPKIPAGYKLVPETKSERTQLLFRPTTKDTLREIAAARGISLNDLVNQILEEYIERQGKE